jgi:uncharacterized protein YukE
MSDVHANLDELERFAGILRRATEDIQKQTDRLAGEYRRLGSTWKDRKFASFQSDFDRSIGALRSATRALEPYPPQLKRHSDALRRYLNSR